MLCLVSYRVMVICTLHTISNIRLTHLRTNMGMMDMGMKDAVCCHDERVTVDRMDMGE